MRSLRIAAALAALLLPVAAQEGAATGKYSNEALGIEYTGIYGWESRHAEGSGAWTELVRYINDDYQALVILSVRNNTYGTTSDLRKALEVEFKEGGEPGPGKSVYKGVSFKDATMKRGNKLPAVDVEAIATRVTDEGKKRERKVTVRTYLGRNRLFRIHCSVKRSRAKRVRDYFDRAVAALTVTGSDEKVVRGTPFQSLRGRYRCLVPEGFTAVLPSRASYDVYFDNRKIGVRIYVYAYAYDGGIRDHIDELVDFYGDDISEPKETKVLGSDGFTATVTKNDQVTLVAGFILGGRVYRIHTRAKKDKGKAAERVHAEVQKSFRAGR